ncbi:MAG: hypothetical protein ACFFBH_09225 [Promethearchaeota archaeon]
MTYIKNMNTDALNDVLIEVSKKPDKKDLIFFDNLIENIQNSLLEKVKINLIYLLGEIGKNNFLEKKYINYLIKSYFNSDRWERNEIIQSLAKIININEVSSEIFDIIAYAILEEYIPTKINALKLLKKLNPIPNIILKNLIKVIDFSNLEVVEYSIQILKEHIKNDLALFSMLNTDENYALLTKNSVRTLLIEYFNSVIDLTNFKEKILESNWKENYKTLFVKEIESYQRILLNQGKNLS